MLVFLVVFCFLFALSLLPLVVKQVCVGLHTSKAETYTLAASVLPPAESVEVYTGRKRQTVGRTNGRKVRKRIAVCAIQAPHRYGNSRAIWDHTVEPMFYRFQINRQIDRLTQPT